MKYSVTCWGYDAGTRTPRYDQPRTRNREATPNRVFANFAATLQYADGGPMATTIGRDFLTVRFNYGRQTEIPWEYSFRGSREELMPLVKVWLYWSQYSGAALDESLVEWLRPEGMACAAGVPTLEEAFGPDGIAWWGCGPSGVIMAAFGIPTKLTHYEQSNWPTPVPKADLKVLLEAAVFARETGEAFLDCLDLAVATAPTA